MVLQAMWSVEKLMLGTYTFCHFLLTESTVVEQQNVL